MTKTAGGATSEPQEGSVSRASRTVLSAPTSTLVFLGDEGRALSAVQDWHPGAGDSYWPRANTTGGKSARGHKGRPNLALTQTALPSPKPSALSLLHGHSRIMEATVKGVVPVETGVRLCNLISEATVPVARVRA